MATTYEEVKAQLAQNLEKSAKEASAQDNLNFMLNTDQDDLLNKIGLGVQRR